MKRRYFPDIYVPNDSSGLFNNDTIIEVKSQYIFDKKTDYFEEKKQAVLDAGFDFQCWTFSKNGELLKTE